MSHFIQDNQAVVKTADNRILLFIKGGDNNCFSYDNKRVTSWHLQNTFSNEDEYNDFITEIMMSDISGGSWQFNSLKNKIFDGYTQYENTIYSRFDKALKNAITTTDWKISDITVENIYDFENALMKLFRSRNISLKDESGCEAQGLGFIWSYTDDVTKEAAGLNRLEKRKGFKLRDGNKEYKIFCQKYSDKYLTELINDVRFCSDITKFDKNWNKSISVLEKLNGTITTDNVDFACFNILTNSNEATVRDLLSSHYIDTMLVDYPKQFETLKCLNQFHQKVKNILESEKSNDYSLKRFKENYKKIIDANYTQLKADKKVKIEDIESNSKDKFVETWNGLIDDCWFKQTNERLPRKVKELKFAIDTNTFTLNEIKKQCNNDFRNIITKHQHQQKKNQPVIKKIFKDLINEYYVLFDENSVDELCSYFGFEKPLQQIKIKEVVETKEQDKITQVTQLSLFDFAA